MGHQVPCLDGRNDAIIIAESLARVTLRTQILKNFILAWTLEIFKFFAWKFHSRLKTSFSLENFNLDLENSPQLGPLLCGSLENFILDWRFHSRLKISIPDENLENFQSLGPLGIAAIRIANVRCWSYLPQKHREISPHRPCVRAAIRVARLAFIPLTFAPHVRAGFRQNGFFCGFLFLSRRIFCGFSRRIFSPHFCGKKCPGKSAGKSSKINTTKILQHISADWPGQHMVLRNGLRELAAFAEC